MIPQLTTMLQMQDAMNQRVHPQWREQGYAWYRAIWTECAELMDHYGWKWWKKQTPDYDQVILELVDIWHFGLSIRLLEAADTGEAAESIAPRLAPLPPPGDFRDNLEAFTLETLRTRDFPVTLFAHLMADTGLDFEGLYVRYMGKNVLNFFRQDNGYREGHYLKTWDGREDNEHLVEIVAGLDTDSLSFKEDLYASLEQRYRRATGVQG